MSPEDEKFAAAMASLADMTLYNALRDKLVSRPHSSPGRLTIMALAVRAAFWRVA